MYNTVSLKEMMSNRILNQDIIDKINGLISLGLDFSIDNGPWIAGGSMFKCITNTELGNSDIDIFFCDTKNKFLSFKIILENAGYKMIKENKDVKTLKKDNVTIQLIGIGYSNVYELLNDFDFSIVRCAFDGEQFVFHWDFLRDIETKKIRYNSTIPARNNTASRIIKYVNRGFTVSTREALSLMLHNRKTTKDLYKRTPDMPDILGVKPNNVQHAPRSNYYDNSGY